MNTKNNQIMNHRKINNKPLNVPLKIIQKEILKMKKKRNNLNKNNINLKQKKSNTKKMKRKDAKKNNNLMMKEYSELVKMLKQQDIKIWLHIVNMLVDIIAKFHSLMHPKQISVRRKRRIKPLTIRNSRMIVKGTNHKDHFEISIMNNPEFFS